MNFYKIIKDAAFVGVGTSDDLLRFQQKHRILLRCDEQKAEYIQFGDALYHDNWMLPASDSVDCLSAEVIQICAEEYSALTYAIESGVDIVQEPAEEQESETIIVGEDVTVEFVRESKIAEMSKVCSDSIISGVDVTLGDGSVHHYSMTVYDQLNLVAIATELASGKDSVAYHADGEPYLNYTAEDMNLIISAANSHRVYHTTYFSTLREYINTLEDIKEIADVYYGMEVN